MHNTNARPPNSTIVIQPSYRKMFRIPSVRKSSPMSANAPGNKHQYDANPFHHQNLLIRDQTILVWAISIAFKIEMTSNRMLQLGNCFFMILGIKDLATIKNSWRFMQINCLIKIWIKKIICC